MMEPEEVPQRAVDRGQPAHAQQHGRPARSPAPQRPGHAQPQQAASPQEIPLPLGRPAHPIPLRRRRRQIRQDRLEDPQRIPAAVAPAFRAGDVPIVRDPVAARSGPSHLLSDQTAGSMPTPTHPPSASPPPPPTSRPPPDVAPAAAPPQRSCPRNSARPPEPALSIMRDRQGPVISWPHIR